MTPRLENRNPTATEAGGRHGGQSWYRNAKVLEDLSVTVNPLGPPNRGMEALAEALPNISRYPAGDWEPARSSLCQFLGLRQQKVERDQVLLGNGASELIDLLIRYLWIQGARSYVTGQVAIQYREYERSAATWGMNEAGCRSDADLHLLVNPNNPAGSFLAYEEITSYVRRHCREGSSVVIDESMLPWLGPDWIRESVLSDMSWLNHLATDNGIAVFVIHSWTKLWSCPGLRIGSLACPTQSLGVELARLMVPWNVNVLALRFLEAAIGEEEFLSRTWETTREWRRGLVGALEGIGQGWRAHGVEWLPWVWLDVGCAATADAFLEASIDSGLPVRPGSMGYEQNSFVRIRVCSPGHQEILIRALRKHRVVA